ncbi:unnamed protein product [Durusdinium trenchii]|uniref:Uncharacterized protein n=1 Tax=Durusdinium trenchii TaxID=1381693 RepID=A0ABP0PCH2_9DINO
MSHAMPLAFVAPAAPTVPTATRSAPPAGYAAAQPLRRASRATGGFLRFAAVFCGIVSARTFSVSKDAGSAGVRAGPASRGVAQRAEGDSGRVVHIKAEKVKEVKLPQGRTETMDALMRKEAVQILAAGAERTEEAKGEKGIWFAYMKPTRMGTWKNQARLKCKLELAKSGAVNVEVVEIEVGSWDRDLKKFKYEKFAEESFSLNWMNRMTWQEKGTDLYLLHTSRGDMKLLLPWWFPLPDAVVKATFQAGIRYMISDGQAKISDAVIKRYKQL